MAKMISQRALALLKEVNARPRDEMVHFRTFSFNDISITAAWVVESGIVKKLSYGVQGPDYLLVLMEVISKMMKGKVLEKVKSLTLRECEAYLRDRNSELSIEQLDANDEALFHNLIHWLCDLPGDLSVKDYHFGAVNGAFSRLGLVEKVRELKAFFNGSKVHELYQGKAIPELLDIEGMTVYVQVGYENEQDIELFSKLHSLAVATFKESELNLIPET